MSYSSLAAVGGSAVDSVCSWIRGPFIVFATCLPPCRVALLDEGLHLDSPPLDLGDDTSDKGPALDGTDGCGATWGAQYEAGASLAELAARAGKSPDVVRRQLLAAGVRLRTRHRLPTDRGWWVSQIENGRSNVDIAAEIQVHPDTVGRYLRAAGLRLPVDRTQPTFNDWLQRRVRPDGDCVRWTGAHTNSGYASTQYRGRKCLVHRLAWEQHHGSIPDGYELTRTSGCSQPDCVNLDHLQVMTPADRIRAKVAAGAFAHGEQHWNAHLTESEVETIRTSFEQTIAVAARYGVTRQTITSIRAGHRWKHLLRPEPADASEPARL